MMENSKDTGKILGVLALGVLVGAALGVLFAPDKGSKTRSRLMGGSSDIADEVKQKMREEADVFRARAAELEELAEGKSKLLPEQIKQNLDVFKNHS